LPHGLGGARAESGANIAAWSPPALTKRTLYRLAHRTPLHGAATRDDIVARDALSMLAPARPQP
jgi:hypothetical protein